MKNPLQSSVEQLLDELYIAAEGAGLRQEDFRKAKQVASMLVEVEHAVRHCSSRSPFLMVDAAAGKSYLGLLAARLVFERMGTSASILCIEHDPRRTALSRAAAERLGTNIKIDFLTADVSDASAWPLRPTLVTALHACGPAADAVIEKTVASEARMLLLVPCCTGSSIPGIASAERKAELFGFSRHAPIRRRFIQSMIDAQRTWRLEAAGYQTEVVEFVAPTVTPHNLLWRSRRVMEPKRMSVAREMLARIQLWGQSQVSPEVQGHL
jgi:hypothetical protein